MRFLASDWVNRSWQVLVVSWALHAHVALAADRYGPWTFEDDTPFADTARFVVRPTRTPFLDDSAELVGNTPDRCLYNLGYPCHEGPGVLELGFIDLPIVNGPGHDFVVFDAPFSPNVYEIAVQPEGAELTPYRPYAPSVQTGRDACLSHAFELLGVPVDLSDYGLRAGTVVRHIRIKGDCATNPGLQSDGAEIDIAMAAVLRGANSCAAATCLPGEPEPEVDAPPRCPYPAQDCQPCKSDGECGSGEFPGQCAPHGFCAQCWSDAQCVSAPCAVGRCVADLGQCVWETKPGCTQPTQPSADASVPVSDGGATEPASWQADDDAADCGCRAAGRGRQGFGSSVALLAGLGLLLWSRRKQVR